MSVSRRSMGRTLDDGSTGDSDRIQKSRGGPRRLVELPSITDHGAKLCPPNLNTYKRLRPKFKPMPNL